MKKNIFVGVFVSVFLSGCAYYQTIGVSSTSIGSQYERPSGIAEGHATRWMFFPFYGLTPVGEDSLKAAISDAMVGRVGDTLANVYAERKTIAFPHILFPIVIKTEVIVTGTLVKYNTKEFPADNDQLVDFKKLQSGAEAWDKLLSLDEKDQRKLVKKLSETGRISLEGVAQRKEAGKEIKEDTYEADLFKVIMGRNVYQPANGPEYWQNKSVPQLPVPGGR